MAVKSNVKTEKTIKNNGLVKFFRKLKQKLKE